MLKKVSKDKITKKIGKPEKQITRVINIVGETGKDGETPSTEQLLDIIKPLIPEVKDGKTPTKEELKEIIKTEIPTVEEIAKIVVPQIPVIKGDKGDKLKFSDLTIDERASLEGPRGVPGMTVRLSDIYEGTWNVNSSYLVDEIVVYNDNTYFAKRPNKGVTPGTNDFIWQFLAPYTGGGGGGGSVYVNGVEVTDPNFEDSAEIEVDVTGSDVSFAIVSGSIDETKLDTSVNASLDLADTAVQPAGLSGYELLSNKATDFTTVNNTLYPTVQAVNNAINTAVTGLLDYRGSYDASTNLFPATGGSGLLGAVLKGDFWICSVPGTLGGTPVTLGDLIIAIVDTPGQTASNWDLIENTLGYTPENVANKENTTIDTNTTKYPTVNLLKTGLDTKQATGNYITALTGDVTASGPGSVAATIAAAAISGKTLKSSLAGTEEVLINDAGTLKKTTAQDIADLGGSGSITGANTEVLFFDGTNNPAGDQGFKYTKVNRTLTLGYTGNGGGLVGIDGLNIYDVSGGSGMDMVSGDIVAYTNAGSYFKVRNATNGRDVSYDLSALTADRIHTLPDASGTYLLDTDIASGTITARADDINFSGGSDGDVLTVQSDGSLALETPSGGGQVNTVVGGTGIDVDATDPVNPEVNLDSASIASLALADSALQSSDIGVTVQAHSSVLDNTTASFTTTDETKLDGIEALADVTDTANVTAAGALMDSEVTNLAAVKAFDPANYATAAQGTKADSALQAANISDTAYDATTWNGVTTIAPSKNAVRDKIETMDSAIALNTAKVTNATHTGDVTGATALTIANDAVTYAKMQNASANTVIARAENSSGDLSEVALSASQLLGRGDTGDVAAITLGTGLTMTGTTLSASSSGGDWSRLASVAISGSAAQTLASGTITAKNYLRVVAMLPSGLSTTDAIALRFNGDTTNNYAWGRSTNGGAYSNNVSQSSLVVLDAGNTNEGMISVDIMNFTATRKRVRGNSSWGEAVASGSGIIQDVGGTWGNTAAQITSIELRCSAGVTMPIGTTMIIYGSN